MGHSCISLCKMKNKKVCACKKRIQQKKEMDLTTSNYDLVANMNGNQLHLNVQLGGSCNINECVIAQ